MATTTTTTPTETTDTAASASSSASDPRHELLRGRPVVWASVGILQTLLTAGIVFGWASLLPIFRAEEGINHTPQEFASIFTCGAIGNYLSTLMFGVTLDRYGPRITAILASSGAGAVYMSSQAAAFDGVTAIFVWPDTVLEAIEDNDEEEEEGGISETLSKRTPSAASLTSSLRSPYIGTASSRMMVISPQLSIASNREALTNAVTGNNNKSLVNAPLNTVLKHPSFWTLAIWTPLVNWSENQGDYTSANTVLLLLTVPLFFVGFWANPKNVPTTTKATTATATALKNSKNHIDDEERVLLIPPERKPRSYSSAQ
eukprot:scaffold4291_cov75-Cylindrotheca_fusiformis.AAC.2